MKKVAILSVFAALVIAAAFLAQCGGDDKSPCEELADKVMDCMKAACNGKDSCEACKCILDPKAEGCSSGSTTTTDAKCEGDTKTAAEAALKDFKCDTYDAAIKMACP